MRRQDLTSNISRLFPYALVATVIVVVFPIAVGVLAVKIGQPHVSPLLASALGATSRAGSLRPDRRCGSDDLSPWTSTSVS
ncbi:MAG: hypothetical protein QOH26_992 [Actinomycetota bacterium]|nr:hypothetical protein [Actinomycetota bacterium]